MTPYQMPWVAVEGSATRHTIDLYARVQAGEKTVSLRTLPVGTRALKPGDAVQMRVHPETGRVFDITKR
jgi:hypothetical protein